MEDKLFEIFQQIDASNSLLSLEDNWDGEGAIKCNPVLLQRSLTSLKLYTKEVFNKLGVIIPIPQINLCKDGTINFEWRKEHEILLINFKEKILYPITYFGHFGKTLGKEDMVWFTGVISDETKTEPQLLYLLSKIEKWKQ